MQTLKPVSFIHNRPLKFRKRKSENFKEGETHKFITDSDRIRWGGVLDKNIQTYRMWFLFLKLALELEKQGASLILKRANDKGSKKENRIVLKVRVKREKYKGWDLDQVLTQHFDDWWKTHRYLFLDEAVHILNSGDVVKTEAGYLYVKINTNRRIRDINATLRSYIETAPRHKSQSKFAVNGNPRPLVLQNRYNALLLKLENKLRDKEILLLKNKYVRVSDLRIRGGYGTRHVSRIMFGLISGNERVFGAKQILMSVCDGYFVRHPTKTYLS